MKLIFSAALLVLLSLISSPLALAQETADAQNAQETADAQNAEKQPETKSAEKQPETKKLTVSTEQNMEKKPGTISLGLGIKRKGLLLFPVVTVKAKRPTLEDRDSKNQQHAEN